MKICKDYILQCACSIVKTFFSKFSSNSETFVSELLENLQEGLHVTMAWTNNCMNNCNWVIRISYYNNYRRLSTSIVIEVKTHFKLSKIVFSFERIIKQTTIFINPFFLVRPPYRFNFYFSWFHFSFIFSHTNSLYVFFWGVHSFLFHVIFHLI